MDKSTILCLVFLGLWLAFLVMTIVLLAIGIGPEDLVGEFLGLASPLIYLLVRKRRK